MADSDNSRTLPAITHGNLLPTVERFLSDEAGSQACGETSGIDPALAKWAEWVAAFFEFDRLCGVQQRLETQLMRKVVSPLVAIEIAGSARPFLADSEQAIEAVLHGEEFAEERARFVDELRTRREAWDAEAVAIGYTRAKLAEEVASDREAELVKVLFDTHASTVHGATAKLHAIVQHHTPEPHNNEYPWPQIRSVLVDLLKICETAPATSPAPSKDLQSSRQAHRRFSA